MQLLSQNIMDPILSSAASGMRARMESLEMLANNLANASTGGYKSDREFYSVYTAAEAAGPVEDGLSPSADSQPVIEKHWTDYSQGNLKQTGNSLDLALDGPGFFQVNGPSGPLYTRNGNFRLNTSGVLTTSEGYPVRAVDGTTIQSQSSSPLVIDKDGTVLQDGQDIGQISVKNFSDQTAIDKQGVNFFLNTNPDMKPTSSSAAVQQGQLEESNVGSAESAVRLVSVMRQFESLQKAISLGSEMNKSAEEVARVGQ